MLEVLQDFKSAALPLEWLLQVGGCGGRPGWQLACQHSVAWPACLPLDPAATDHLPAAPLPHARASSQAAPRLKPRLFSIASAPTLHPGTAQLAVAIVDWATPFKRRRRGVCTSWLAGLDPEQVGDGGGCGAVQCMLCWDVVDGTWRGCGEALGTLSSWLGPPVAAART